MCAEAVVAAVDGGDVLKTAVKGRAVDVYAVVVDMRGGDVPNDDVRVLPAELQAGGAYRRGNACVIEFASLLEFDVERAKDLLRAGDRVGGIFDKSPFVDLEILGHLQGGQLPFGGAAHVVHFPIKEEEPALQDRFVSAQKVVVPEQAGRDLLPIACLQGIAALENGSVAIQNDRFARLGSPIVKDRRLPVGPRRQVDRVSSLREFQASRDGLHRIGEPVVCVTSACGIHLNVPGKKRGP